MSRIQAVLEYVSHKLGVSRATTTKRIRQVMKKREVRMIQSSTAYYISSLILHTLKFIGRSVGSASPEIEGWLVHLRIHLACTYTLHGLHGYMYVQHIWVYIHAKCTVCCMSLGALFSLPAVDASMPEHLQLYEQELKVRADSLSSGGDKVRTHRPML